MHTFHFCHREPILGGFCDFSIQGLLVVDESDRLVGALNFQDLLKAGVV